MNQRTVNIILCCKDFGRGSTVIERIANYMSAECDCPPEMYTHSVVCGLLKEAARDFVRSNPQAAQDFSLKFLDYIDQPPVFASLAGTSAEANSLTERLIYLYARTFMMLQVKEKAQDKYHYINGFTEEQVKKGEDFLRFT